MKKQPLRRSTTQCRTNEVFVALEYAAHEVGNLLAAPVFFQPQSATALVYGA